MPNKGRGNRKQQCLHVNFCGPTCSYLPDRTSKPTYFPSKAVLVNKIHSRQQILQQFIKKKIFPFIPIYSTIFLGGLANFLKFAYRSTQLSCLLRNIMQLPAPKIDVFLTQSFRLLLEIKHGGLVIFHGLSLFQFIVLASQSDSDSYRLVRTLVVFLQALSHVIE